MHADGKSTLASVSKWNSGKANFAASEAPEEKIEGNKDGVRF